MTVLVALSPESERSTKRAMSWLMKLPPGWHGLGGEVVGALVVVVEVRVDVMVVVEVLVVDGVVTGRVGEEVGMVAGVVDGVVGGCVVVEGVVVEGVVVEDVVEVDLVFEVMGCVTVVVETNGDVLVVVGVCVDVVNETPLLGDVEAVAGGGVHVVPQSSVNLVAILPATSFRALVSVISGIRNEYPSPDDKFANPETLPFPTPIVIILLPPSLNLSVKVDELATSVSRLAIITIVFPTGGARLPL